VTRHAEGRLTQRQDRFVVEYLRDLNATKAAIRAGYSARNADKIGSRLVGESRIAAIIAARQARRAKRADLTAERTLEEIRRLMTSDIGNYLDEDGKPVNIRNLPEDWRAPIERLKFDENGNIREIKLWSKTQAIHLAAMHLRLLVELREKRTDLEERIKAMTMVQRREFVIELIGKARAMFAAR